MNDKRLDSRSVKPLAQGIEDNFPFVKKDSISFKKDNCLLHERKKVIPPRVLGLSLGLPDEGTEGLTERFGN